VVPFCSLVVPLSKLTDGFSNLKALTVSKFSRGPHRHGVSPILGTLRQLKKTQTTAIKLGTYLVHLALEEVPTFGGWSSLGH
jgi:hypothetical protein